MKTLTDILHEHLDYQRSLKLSKNTRRACYYNIRRALQWIEENCGITTPERLRASHLHAWHKHICSRHTAAGQPLRPRSVNKMIENFRGFLEYMARCGYVHSRLVMAVEYVKEPKLLPGNTLTHKQVRKLLETIKPDSTQGFCVRTMLETIYSTGMRASELLGMNTDSIDFSAGTALIMGKGSKQRVVPVGKTALKFLENYLAGIRPYLVNDPSEKALFLTSEGKRLPYYTFRRILLARGKAAGLDVPLTAHTFRRSCTTELLKGGAGMYHVKELLGHESLETLRHYAKLTIMDLKATHRKYHPRERDWRGGGDGGSPAS